jgi:group I intron endonuclease
MNGRIYSVTNTVNEKQYVGQTITKYSKQGHGHAIKNAYKKYGRKSFTYDVVFSGVDCPQLLDFAEKFWIKVFGSIQPHGYNLEEGGRRHKNVNHKPNLGKKASNETKAKMSASQKEYWAAHGSPNKGRKHSEETKAKMSAARSKRVYTDEDRMKISEAVKEWHKNRKAQV